MTSILFDHEDVARGQLDASLSAAGLTIVLNAGEGAEFPQPLNGDCSSLGSSTTLNDTGALGSLAVGDFIRNVTDGSWAYVTSIAGAPNAVTTTPLMGGTDNTWESADVWRHGEFIVTLIKTADGLATGAVTQRERVLISGRSTDQLTVPTGGRAYDGTSAQSFDPDDFVNLYICAITFDSLRDVLKDVRNYIATIKTDLTTAQTNITNLQTGSYFYVVTTGSANAYVAATPALAAYAAGNIIMFKANFSNTGAATINLNSLGAKSIKKLDGATALAANDIISGQIVIVQYDGTNFQMLSPIGTAASSTGYDRPMASFASDSATLTNPTSSTPHDTHTYTIPADWLTATTWVEFEFTTVVVHGTAGQYNSYVRLGSTDFDELSFGSNSGTVNITIKGKIMGTAASGASVAVRCEAVAVMLGGAKGTARYTTANFATNGTLAITLACRFETSNGSNTSICKMSTFRKCSTVAF